MNAVQPVAARFPLWLLADSQGAVTSYSPGSERILNTEPQGRTLTELFSAEVARRLLSGSEDSLEWCRPADEGTESSAWRLERRRLEGGELLVRGASRAQQEEVPSAWERRITRRLIHPYGDVIEQQRRFMLSIFDADPNLIFVKDRRGRFIFVNKAVGELFGTTPDEVVLARNADVHDIQEELKVYDEVDQRVLNTRSVVRLEESVTRPDGKVFWCDTHKRPLDAPNGETFVLGISVDITERRRVEELLQETNRRLELAVSAGQLGLWDWDVTANSVYFSPGWKAHLGYEDSELPNQFETLVSRLHPEDSERVLEGMNRHVRDPASGDRFTHEFRMRARDDSWRWIASYGVVGRDARGQGVRVTGFHADITERKDREAAQEVLRENQRLERLARLKDEFLANMSHELRTPLNAVLGQSEAMADGIFGPVTEEQRAALKTIEESGEHLLSLINDVLDISKSSVGHLEVALEVVTVDEVCQESLRLVREQARRKGITVAYSSDAAGTCVWADRRRWRQVLLNLLSNAQKFTPEGGRIGLEVTARSGGEVAFTVWDTGPGIAEADRQRIFEPFVQLDVGLNRRHEGTGLGLALVHRLVELHHGRLELESELGKGSRFTVVLPVREPEAAEALLPPVAAPRAPAPRRPATSLDCTVLIADDNEANTQHLEDYLEAYGCRVVIARDGEEALRLCREVNPTVVLMDIQMPRMSGLEAIQRLRAEPAIAHLPVVALTALAMPGDRERCLSAGANDYLSKPVRLADVLRVVQQWSSNPAARG
ncbi:hybrid sensor histidine kinase/response regulator [Hyalangium versicolor]|uniref:hybrid sensor histidine kinase/response regulator n=1 Tax=Hyalangium versicolor TaxID=2861190 RepID=UPI001CC9610E|nr:PAS domain-containing hybrid sensor histidine kinase/response regulator [Hyalangium versicolor]